MAVILTSQVTTKVMPEGAASLQPAISGTAWDSGIHNRLLLFRDWQVETSSDSGQEKYDAKSDLRYAAVTKAGGNALHGCEEVVPFTIEKYGLREIETVPSATVSMQEPTVPRHIKLKRKRNEIADSASETEDLTSDDEFSWAED
ncbi:MAG: hypothetical protein Q9219_003252 [cf. Caloplaca sp. 3 TL-2023]